MKKPKNMPPYPTKKRMALDLVAIRKELHSELMFLERSLIAGDFTNFRKTVQIRKELKNINEKLSSPLMEYYAKKK